MLADKEVMRDGDVVIATSHGWGAIGAGEEAIWMGQGRGMIRTCKDF